MGSIEKEITDLLTAAYKSTRIAEGKLDHARQWTEQIAAGRGDQPLIKLRAQYMHDANRALLKAQMLTALAAAKSGTNLPIDKLQ